MKKVSLILLLFLNIFYLNNEIQKKEFLIFKLNSNLIKEQVYRANTSIDYDIIHNENNFRTNKVAENYYVTPNSYPLFIIIGGLIAFTIGCFFKIFKKNKTIIPFSKENNLVYLKKEKFNYYEDINMLSSRKLLDLRFTFYNKNRFEYSTICIHFKTKKFIPIKKFKFSVFDEQGKDVIIVDLKDFNPYHFNQEAVIQKWGIKYYDPYIQLSIKDFLNNKTMLLGKYEYAKGYKNSVSTDTIKLYFKFADGSEENFELKANDKDMMEQYHKKFKLERISINKEGELIYPYYNDFIEDCAYLYMYDKKQWIEVIEAFYNILSHEENFSKLITSQSYAKDELNCFSEFLYDIEPGEEVEQFVRKIIEKYYSEKEGLNFRKDNIVTEIKDKLGVDVA